MIESRRLPKHLDEQWEQGVFGDKNNFHVRFAKTNRKLPLQDKIPHFCRDLKYGLLGMETLNP
jgi:hypothetical protein